MAPRFVIRFCFVALAAVAGLPAIAQTAPDPLATARAAEARLDFAAALEMLSDGIAATPEDPAPRLARAALHRKMNRPSLALDDLAAVLAQDAANREARLARADLYLALGALSRSLEDLEALLARDPEDVTALIGRARVHTRSGLTALALADYDTALALAPQTPGLATERARIAAPAPTGLLYDPEALMAPRFRLSEGAGDAGRELVIVHAGDSLAEEEALLPRGAYLPAIESGLLRVTHLFTLTGRDGAIWANLALICAGQQGFGATWSALASSEATRALAAIDSGRGRAAFDALVSEAYAAAGLVPETAADCAFSRTKAVEFLADWSDTREAAAWRGATIYDAAPVFVLDGTVIGAADLGEQLADLAGPESGPRTETFDAAPAPASPDPATAAPLEEPAAPVAPATPEAPATDAAVSPPLPAGFGPIDETARLPAELRGVWAPSLVDCLAYEETISAPTTLDAALPRLNPLDGPPLGTVLLTSRRMVLRNAVGTDCELVDIEGSAEGFVSARLACRNRAAPEVVVPMALRRVAGDGPAPKLSVTFGEQAEIDLLQCRPLGALGRSFGPLWTVDPDACRASAPVESGLFHFEAANDTLNVAVAPSDAPEAAATSGLTLTLDGNAFDGTGQWADGGWQLALAPFAEASERLAQGLLLDAHALAPDGRTIWTRLLPLLGSGEAMAALAACAKN